MSVLFITPSFSCGTFGGIQTSARVAWEGLCRFYPEGGAERLEYSGGDAENGRAGRVGFVWKACRASAKRRKLLFWHLGLIKLLPVLRRGEASSVLYLHGIEAWRPLNALTRFCLQNVDLFLTNSEYTWQRFVEKHPLFAERSHLTVPLGLGEAGAIPALPPGKPAGALMLGRMDSRENYKGHEEVIRSWPLVLRGLPDARLRIAGSGDLRGRLESAAAELGVSRQVMFCGPVDEVEKERLLAESRCLVLPSAAEGFGLVYLEAMRVGRPCLASTLDAGREVVNPPEAGLAVDPKDLPSVAGAIVTLLDDGEDWTERSIRARERYSRNFTARHFQERLLAAISAL